LTKTDFSVNSSALKMIFFGMGNYFFYNAYKEENDVLIPTYERGERMKILAPIMEHNLN
jgi:hypothetical protein